MVEIVVDQKIRHGKPIIKGTRITVGEILELLNRGLTSNDIQKEYCLTKEQIKCVGKYRVRAIE